MNLALNTRVFLIHMVRSAIANLVWPPTGVLGCVLSLFIAFTALPAQEAAPKVVFVTPNFSKALFDIDSILLESGELRVVTNALSALAANFSGDSRIGPGLRAKALAISLRLDGTHRDSVLTLQKLRQGETPLPVPGFEEPNVVALELWQLAETLDRADASRDDHVLACYLMDIAMRIDPERAGGSARLKKLSKKGKFLGWQGVIAVVNEPLAKPPAAAKPAGAKPQPPAGKERGITDKKPAVVERVPRAEDAPPLPAGEGGKPEPE